MIVLATASAGTRLADDLIERWATSADRLHAGARRSQPAQYHSLLARAGIRALLFSHTAQNDWDLRADPRGKLLAFDGSGAVGPSICVAHTPGMVACSLGKARALGIDIERHRPRDFGAIAAWSFGPLEQAGATAGEAAAFYRIWTLREAMGKATGEGLALATDRMDRVGSGPDDGTWRARVNGQDWLLNHSRVGSDISVAVAVLLSGDESVDATVVRWVDFDATVCADVSRTNP